MAEECIKQPRAIIKNTISNWNRCSRQIGGWPAQRLSSPFRKTPYTFPLDAFPESFRTDVAAFARRLSDPDPLDDDGPLRPLSSHTVDHRITQIRQFASALVHSEVAHITEIVSIAFVLEPVRFKEALRFHLKRRGNKTASLHNQANALRLIAKHHCKFDYTRLRELETLCHRVDPHLPQQMTERNRTRLRQFDDPENIRRLLYFPEDQARLAARETNPLRAARCTERAVAVALLTYCGLRIESLRRLHLEEDFAWQDRDGERVCYLSVPGTKTKNRRPLEFELPVAVSDLIRDHLETYRRHLPGSDSPWLFPGLSGSPRSRNALREGITAALRRETGLIMNPHLFRHAIAKIAVEEDSGAYHAVSRVLGHQSMDTTTGHYLGTETKAAAKQIDRIIRSAKERDRAKKPKKRKK